MQIDATEARGREDRRRQQNPIRHYDANIGLKGREGPLRGFVTELYRSAHY